MSPWEKHSARLLKSRDPEGQTPIFQPELEEKVRKRREDADFWDILTLLCLSDPVGVQQMTHLGEHLVTSLNVEHFFNLRGLNPPSLTGFGAEPPDSRRIISSGIFNPGSSRKPLKLTGWRLRTLNLRLQPVLICHLSADISLNSRETETMSEVPSAGGG